MSSEHEIDNGDWPDKDKLPVEVQEPILCQTCGVAHPMLQPGYKPIPGIVIGNPPEVGYLRVESQEAGLLKKILETMQENNILLKNLIDVRDSNPNEEMQAIIIHESEATCPNCEGLAVKCLKQDDARLYKCMGCNFTWANSEADVLVFSQGIEVE